jgi:hypothetical protein
MGWATGAGITTHNFFVTYKWANKLKWLFLAVLQPGPLFVGNFCERCLTRVGSGLTWKHQTRVERPAWNKHSSLSCLCVSYEENKVLQILSQFFMLKM